MPADDDDDDQDDGIGPLLPKSKWTLVPSRFEGKGALSTGRTVRSAISGLKGGVSAGHTVASHAHLLTAVGVAGAGALAVGTGGIAVAAVGAGLTVAGIGTSAVSLHSTYNHITALGRIKANPGSYGSCRCEGACPAEMTADHRAIQEIVVPYIIAKKRAKAVKKGMNVVGLSLGTTAHRMGKAAYKSLSHTKGLRREFYAYVLARHTVTHECGLAKAVVAELYSEPEYFAIRTMDSTEAAKRLAAKMKST